jgi:hypothetical protein
VVEGPGRAAGRIGDADAIVVSDAVPLDPPKATSLLTREYVDDVRRELAVGMFGGSRSSG